MKKLFLALIACLSLSVFADQNTIVRNDRLLTDHMTGLPNKLIADYDNFWLNTPVGTTAALPGYGTVRMSNGVLYFTANVPAGADSVSIPVSEGEPINQVAQLVPSLGDFFMKAYGLSAIPQTLMYNPDGTSAQCTGNPYACSQLPVDKWLATYGPQISQGVDLGEIPAVLP